jgi:hypothetical protein
MMASRTAAPDRRRDPLGSVQRSIVEFALRAPSVHNTQPWRWRIGDACLDLYADRTRQLPLADPLGRNLLVSCGAAVEYAAVGAAAGGWCCVVDLLPEGGTPDHLATLRLSQGSSSWRAAADADLLRARATDRRRFIPWPVSVALLRQLADRSVAGTAWAVAVTDVVDRCNVELLVSRAMATVRSDARLVEEELAWTSGDGSDGVPPANARPADSDLPRLWPTRYDPPQPTDDDSRLLGAPTDGLIVVLSARDDARGWLDSGRLLCRLWADALDHGLSLVPVSQVVEVDDTRRSLRRDVLRTDAHPQLLVRLGWQELARSPLPRTPRRALDDVLMA